ncbi:hypothetical protein EDC04DRAFT_2608172 [Pisolithus marmoratus]|nr:hypothetical protein EDC04DRAFT_2608172 [Pisolithus marmoratus]
MSEWWDTSPKAQLVYHLGLNCFPPLPRIVELCSSSDDEVQEIAFYLDYKLENFCDMEFIPAESKDGFCLKKLEEYIPVLGGNHWASMWYKTGTRVHPLPMGPSSALKLLPPTQCYLDQGAKPKLYAKLFNSVNFGTKSQDISNSTLHKMSHSPALLGLHWMKTEGKAEWDYKHQFPTYQGVTIVNNMNNYQLFSDCLFIAPQEEALKRFYASLGCNYSKACNRILVSKILVAGNMKQIQSIWATVRSEGDFIELWISEVANCDMNDAKGLQHPSAKYYMELGIFGMKGFPWLLVKFPNNMQIGYGEGNKAMKKCLAASSWPANQSMLDTQSSPQCTFLPHTANNVSWKIHKTCNASNDKFLDTAGQLISLPLSQ